MENIYDTSADSSHLRVLNVLGEGKANLLPTSIVRARHAGDVPCPAHTRHLTKGVMKCMVEYSVSFFIEPQAVFQSRASYHVDRRTAEYYLHARRFCPAMDGFLDKGKGIHEGPRGSLER